LLPDIVQDALARIGGLLDTLFETAGDAIFLVDGLRFIDCNPSTLDLFGFQSKAEVVGRTLTDFSPERQPDGCPSKERAEQLASAGLEGAPQHFEWVLRRPDGSPFDVDIRLNRFFVGGMALLVAVVRDITAAKGGQGVLRRRLEAEELINRILSGFAACTPNQLDKLATEALAELARFIQLDHAYFVIPSLDRTTYSLTHEFSGPGVAPQIARNQQVAPGTHPWIESTLIAGETLKIDSVAAEPRAIEWLAKIDPGCRSLLLVATRDEMGRFVGALGVDSHARAIAWSDSDVLLCSIIGNAIAALTERKRAYDRIMREKQFSDRLIDSLPGPFYVFDQNLRLRRWNRNVELLLGYSPDELRDKPLETFAATDADRSDAAAAAQRLLESRSRTEILELGLRMKDGTSGPFLVSAAGIESPTGPWIVGVAFPIADRMRAEKALAASEQKYHQLFDSTNEALLIHDEQGGIIDINARACALFGFERAEAERLSLDDISLGAPPYSAKEALEHLGRALREGVQIFDWRSRRVDGSLFWSEVALRACCTDGRQRVIASVRDVSERKRAALEREKLMAEAQEANRTKDQFLAVLSHELRNPLAAIQAGVGLLRQSTPADGSNSRSHRAMEVIDRNVKLQARLIDDLLDLSRLVRGKLTLRPGPLKLGEVVSWAVQGCRTEAARAEVRLEENIEPEVWADGDADRLEQVVTNLVDNAIKFTPKGGRVKISLSASPAERRARIVVEDTGVGIEPDRLTGLFEMFRMKETALRRAPAPGLGIGLALVRSIVEMHGGAVRAESAGPGRGSRFTVELPVRLAPRVSGGSPPARASVSRLTMLLLEDNEDTRPLLEETFEQLGYDVTAAASGEAALDILSHRPVDVIVADIGLPGIDGYEFLRRARHLPGSSRTTAFALTGYGQDRDLKRAREAGFADYFVKPVDAAVIDQRIRAWPGLRESDRREERR
jgi:PAS domain S-box-containing protein